MSMQTGEQSEYGSRLQDSVLPTRQLKIKREMLAIAILTGTQDQQQRQYPMEVDNAGNIFMIVPSGPELSPNTDETSAA